MRERNMSSNTLHISSWFVQKVIAGNLQRGYDNHLGMKPIAVLPKVFFVLRLGFMGSLEKEDLRRDGEDNFLALRTYRTQN
jgi:hypothetical protein